MTDGDNKKEEATGKEKFIQNLVRDKTRCVGIAFSTRDYAKIQIAAEKHEMKKPEYIRRAVRKALDALNEATQKELPIAHQLQHPIGEGTRICVRFLQWEYSKIQEAAKNHEMKRSVFIRCVVREALENEDIQEESSVTHQLQLNRSRLVAVWLSEKGIEEIQKAAYWNGMVTPSYIQLQVLRALKKEAIQEGPPIANQQQFKGIKSRKVCFGLSEPEFAAFQEVVDRRRMTMSSYVRCVVYLSIDKPAD